MIFRAVFLDLDDTLFDRGAAFGRWAVRFTDARRADFPAHRRAADLATLAELDQRGRRGRAGFAAAVVARFGLDDDASDLARRFPGELAAEVVPEPGVAATVAALAARARVAVVSNGGSLTQRAKLERLGLSRAIGAVFVSEEVGAAKPDPAIFAAALAWAGCPAASCLMIGDDPARDLVPARALGMATAWRVRGAWPVELPAPTYTLASLAEAVGIS